MPKPSAKPASRPAAEPARSAHHRGGITESMEDYLECIAEVIAAQGFVRVTDVAERLGLRRASVSLMVKRLAEMGHLNHIPYRGFTLTGEGREIAARVKERHETLTEFFSLLGLPPEALARDVEGIEHHVSGDTLRLFRRLVAFWKSRPALAGDYARFGA